MSLQRPHFLNLAILLLVALTISVTTSAAKPNRTASRLALAPESQLGQPAMRWLARYDGPAHDFDLTSSTVLSPDNTRVYVTGSSPDNGAYNVDYATIAYDAATGVTIWTARYDGPAHHLDNGRFIAVSPDGSRVFVTGDSNADGSDENYDFATVAYDAATGAQLWISRYDFNAGKEEVAAIGVSPDGTRVYITGTSQVAETNHDYATVAYSAQDGTQLWVARHDGTAQDFDAASGLVISPDGSRVFVTGGSDSGIPFLLFLGQDFVTLAYDAMTGIQLWIATYNPFINGFDTAKAIALSPDGTRVFVAGQSDGADPSKSSDYAVVAYDASNGIEQWTARYNGIFQMSEQLTSLALSHDGARIFVTGASQTPTNDNDYATVAFDAATGMQLWAATYDGTGHGFDAGEAVVVSPDNSTIYVTGASDGGSPSGVGFAPDSFVDNMDCATIAYDAATGAQKWATRFDAAGGNDYATAMTLSSDGNLLYITGGSTTDHFLDYLTMAYQVAGLPLLSVASRKTHGGAGTFDVDLPLTGNPGIECRNFQDTNSGHHQIVLTFATPVTVNGSQDPKATLTAPKGGSVDTVDVNNSVVTVNLKDVGNEQIITLTLLNVSDGANAGDVSIPIGFLFGDVNGDGFVLSGDYTAVRQKSGTTVDENTAKYDVNADGFILSGDYTTVRQQSGAHF